jgi:hypothetical protein
MDVNYTFLDTGKAAGDINPKQDRKKAVSKIVKAYSKKSRIQYYVM